MPERNKAYSRALPFPVKGENSRDPILEMDPSYALRLRNVFPRGNYGEIRKGYRTHSTGLGSGAVDTLVSHNGADGTDVLLAGANGNIYNATTYGGTASSLGSGFTNNRWQTAQYLGNTIFVNGADQPQKYDGSTLGAATYTGITDDAVLVDVTVYKERLYFIEIDSTSFWYGAAGAITGALTEYDVGDFLSLGGYLLACSSWTSNTGSGLQDLLVLVSSEGEILCYAGTDPASDFTLEARFKLPKPHGRRCLTNQGADLFILHQEGVTSIAQLLQGVSTLGGYTQFTNAITPTFTMAADLFGSNQGWELFFYPSQQWAMVNVPRTSSVSRQYVMNTNTSAWCTFEGIPSRCWCEFNSMPYFGGPDGTVYEANQTYSDNGSPIDVSVKYAFNYFGERTRNKLFKLASAQLIGTNNAELLFGMDVDGSADADSGTVDIIFPEGSDWDTEDWDVTDWGQEDAFSTQWEAVAAYGRAGSLRINARIKNSSIKISSTQLIYEMGGYL